jgi:hypothetical protein
MDGNGRREVTMPAFGSKAEVVVEMKARRADV